MAQLIPVGSDNTGPANDDWVAALPKLDQYMKPDQQTTAGGSPNNNFFTSALKSGGEEALGGLGRTVQAVGTLAGLQPVEQGGKGFAQYFENAAQAAGRPDIEQLPWYHPKALAYQALKSAPITAGAALGFGLAGLPGAAAVMFPSAAGANVAPAEQAEGGTLSRTGAAKALGFGLPEAALAAWMPGTLEKIATQGLEGGLAHRVFTGAIAAGGQQALSAGASTAISQEAFTPEMPLADRAKAIVDATMQGGAMGALFGGALGAARRQVRLDTNAPNADLRGAVDAGLGTPPPAGELPPGAPGAGQEAPPNAPAPVAGQLGQGEQARGLPRPGPAFIEEGAQGKQAFAGIPTDALMAEKAKYDEAGINMSTAEAGHAAALNAEVNRRTIPGVGTPTLDAQDVVSRAPAVEALKTNLINDEDLNIPAKQVASNPILRDFNAANEPELINTVDQGLQSYDATGTAKAKKMPEWLVTLGNRYGLLDGKEPSTPEAHIANIQADLGNAQGRLQAATTAQDADGMRRSLAATQDLQTKLGRMQEIDTSYKAGVALKEQAKTPVEQPAISLPGPTKTNNDFAVAREDDVHTEKYLAGMSKDGQTFYVDHRVPPTIPMQRIDTGKTEQVDPRPFLQAHEEAEQALARQGETYQTSHRQGGLPAERAAVEAAGYKWGPYQRQIMKIADNIEKQPAKNPPPDLDTYPYSGQEKAQIAKDQAANGGGNAVREPGAAPVDVRQEAGNGGAVGGGDAQGTAIAEKAPPRNLVTPLEKFKGEQPEAAEALGLNTPPEQLRPAPLPAGELGNLEPATRAAAEAPTAALKSKAREAASVTQLKAIHDAEPEGSPRKIAAAEALAKGTSRAAREAMYKMADEDVAKPEDIAVPPQRQVQLAEAGAPKQYSDANWGESVKDMYHGDLLHQDDRYAVVRAFSRRGNSMYMAADKNRSQVINLDNKEAKNWLGDQQYNRLRSIARDHVAKEKAEYDAHPDGPFEGTKAQNGGAVGTPNVDPAKVGLLNEWMNLIGLGKMRILLADARDTQGAAGDASKFYGPYQSVRTWGDSPTVTGETRPMGPGFKDHYIGIKSDISPGAAVQNLAHELGHIVWHNELAKAPTALRNAVIASFERWKSNLDPSMPAQKFIDMLRNTESRQMVWRGEAGPETPISKLDNIDYFTKFDEWFADNVSKWFTTAAKPVGAIERFFSGVAQKIRQLISAITGVAPNDLPDASVKAFMDKMVDTAGQDVQGWTEAAQGHGGVGDSPVQRQSNVAGMDDRAKSAVASIESQWGKIGDAWHSLPVKIRRGLMGAMDLTTLARVNAKELPSLTSWRDLNERTNAITGAKTLLYAKTSEKFNALPSEAQAAVQEHLAHLQNAGGLVPWKSWEEQRDFHSLPNAADYKARLQALKSEYDNVTRLGGRQALQDVLVGPRITMLMRLVARAHAFGEATEQKSGVRFNNHGANPDDLYRNQAALHDSLPKTFEYYANSLIALRNGIQDHVDDVTSKLANYDQKTSTGRSNAAKIAGGIEGERQFLKELDGNLDLIKKGTYIPLDHGDGKFYVSADMVSGHEAAVQKALDDAGFEVGIFRNEKTGTGNASFMTRVQTEAQMQRMAHLFGTLQEQGHLDKNVPVGTGYPERWPDVTRMLPKDMQTILAAHDEAVSKMEGIDSATKEALRAHLISSLADMVPQSSTIPGMLPRTLASGWSKDMVGSANQDAMKQMRASTSIGTRAERTGTLLQMRGEANNAKVDPTVDPVRRLIPQDAFNEVMQREAQRAWEVPANALDTIQGWMHTVMIGANPAYVLTALSQVPILLHPQLSKKYGYARSAVMIGSVTGRAFNILRSMFSGPGDEKYSAKLRLENMVARGVSPKDMQTILMADAAGKISNSTFTVSQTEGGIVHHFQKMANALGLYSEMLPRIISALAAGDLYDKRAVQGMTRADYVKSVISDSQFNWTPGETSRLTGKAGPLGKYSKITFAFTQFQERMLAKLYTEAHDLFAGDTPRARKEAGRFLISHLTAVMAIAGTTGLPFAAFAAGAIDKIAHTITGDDDYDTIGAYRSWLSHLFGADVADVIAKGLPRAAGIDLSKLGDANLLPGTGIMTDKRKFEDAQKDWYKSMAGSAANEIGNLFLGGRDILNGDYMLGTIKLLPEGFKGLAEAQYMYDHGYVDKNGQKYPMQPGARDILAAALGIDPANLAQYNEAKRIAQGQQAQRQFTEQNISRHLELSFMQHDPAAHQYWMQQGYKYFQAHPTAGPGPIGGFPGALQQHLQNAAVSRGFGLPLDVKPFDSANKYVNFLPKAQ